MLEKYQHIIFDLDGTLVQTRAEYRHLVVPRTLQRLGISSYTARAIDRFWLDGDREITIAQEWGVPSEEFWEHFRKEDEVGVRMRYTESFPDVEEVLASLKQAGKEIAIITDAPAYIADPEIDLLSEGLISWRVSIYEIGYLPKPDSGSFVHCLEKFAIDPASAIYIGNSFIDGKYAQGAKVDFIHVDRGEPNFVPSKYGLRIKSLQELIVSD